MVSLFTTIPIDLAKTIICELLNADETLQDRTSIQLSHINLAINLCLDNTYFCFRNNFYQQMSGFPMGCPITVMIANLVMEAIETQAVNSFINPPCIWKRFVDDTFVILKCKQVEPFFTHINTVNAQILTFDLLLKKSQKVTLAF